MCNIIPQSNFILKMFVRLTTALLILSNHCSAQIESQRTPTKFDKFISKEKIQWAAYANNTLSFDNYNLSDVLYKRFQKGEIKVTLPVSRDSLMAGNKIIYLNKNDLELRSYAAGNYDNSKKPTNRVDSNSSSGINVTEILYVENGKLYSYIPWVSPRISVYTSGDRFIGTTEYFSSGINTKYNFKSPKRDKLIFITSTKRKMLIDSIPRVNMLKQLYGINMLDATWKGVVNGHNEIINLSTEQKTSFDNLKFYDFTGTVDVPIYDSMGKITGTKTEGIPVNATQLDQIEITQNWFYNYTKNRVVNTIPDITLFIRNYYGERIPFIKIIFNN